MFRTVALALAAVATIAAPLPLGPTRTASRLVLALVVACGLLLAMRSRDDAAPTRRGLIALLVVTACLPLAWLVPLPPSAIESLAPAVAREARASLALRGEPAALADAERALAVRAGGPRQEPGARPLTADPDATIAAAAHVALAAAAFALGLLLGARDRERRVLLFALLAAALLQAVIGLAESSSTHRYLFYERTIHFPGLPTGTFVNSNHFAALASLGLFAALALVMTPARGGRERNSGGAAAKNLLAATCAVVLLLAIAWSSSRAALGAAAVGLVLLGVLSVRRADRGMRPWAVLALLAATGLAVVALSVRPPAPLADDLATVDVSARTRLGLWEEGVNVARANPLAGSGPGTFAAMHALGRSGTMPRRIVHVHNDWIEWWSEAGLAGVALPLAWLGLLAAAAVRTVRQRERRAPALPIACGLLALTLHEGVDFPLRLVGVAVPAAIAAGLLVAAAPSPGRRPSREAARGPLGFAAATGTGLAVLAVATAAWSFAGTRPPDLDARLDAFGLASAPARRLAARRALSTELARLRARGDGEADPAVGASVLELQRAALRAPLRSDVRVTQWLAASVLLGPGGASEPDMAALLEHYLARAEALAPASRSRRRTILRYRVAAGHHDEARAVARGLIRDDPRLAIAVWEDLGPAARDLGGLMDATPNEPRAAVALADYLGGERRDPRAARIVLERAAAAHPEHAALALRLAALELEAGAPERALTHADRAAAAATGATEQDALRLRARALLRLGRFDEAARAVDRLEALGMRPASVTLLRAEIDLRAGRASSAAARLRGLDDASLRGGEALRRHVLLGRALEADGDVRGALEEFRRAERIAPDDPGVVSFFERLERATKEE